VCRYELLLVGHSLGGGVAAILSHLLNIRWACGCAPLLISLSMAAPVETATDRPAHPYTCMRATHMMTYMRHDQGLVYSLLPCCTSCACTASMVLAA
jgi:surfactin synthase thioesterase subunit